MDETALVRKDDFLRDLEQAIPTTLYARPILMAVAGYLILDDGKRRFVGDLNDPRIKKAIHLFQQAFPQYGDEIPLLVELIHWLLESNAFDRAAALEERMGWIYNKLTDIGEGNQDDLVLVNSRDIQLLKILSDTS